MLESAGVQYATPSMILPRVVSGQAKSAPHPPPKTFSKIQPESIQPEEGVEKRQK